MSCSELDMGASCQEAFSYMETVLKKLSKVDLGVFGDEDLEWLLERSAMETKNLLSFLKALREIEARRRE
jgi:hypothetical protein